MDQVALIRLRNEVAKILWEKWDPIGMKKWGDSPENEYDSYVLPIISLMLKGGGDKEISTYLEDIETDRMGLATAAGSRQDVATSCLLAYQKHRNIQEVD